MNPPFGAQKANMNADRRFIEIAIHTAPIIYSLHLSKTIPFIKQLLSSLQGTISFQKQYQFPIKWMFHFHKKPAIDYEVTLLRIIQKPEKSRFNKEYKLSIQN
jgi:putative methylase